MKCLVTGGAGLIGSHLVAKLLEEGHEVVMYDDMSGGQEWNIDPESKVIRGDLRNFKFCEKYIEPCDVIYHLAANAAEGKSHFAPVDIVTRNYNTFLNVLTAGIKNGMKRIVVTSSVAVYGSIQPPFKETDEPEPEDLYGLSKLMMEKTLKILSRVHDFEWVVARAHNVYGPRQSMTDPYRNVVMLWINSLLKGKPYTIYGDGSMKRCYTYIDDLVDGLYKMGFADVAGEVINLGADEAYSLKELSDAIQKASGGAIKPQFLPQREGEVTKAILDHSKAKERLGYKTTVNLEEGIRRTWEWSKAKGPKELQYGGIELPSEKMPLNWRIKL